MIGRLLGVSFLGAALCVTAAPAQSTRQPSTLALDPHEIARLRVYHEHIVELAREMRGWGYLGDVMRPVLALAETRARTQDAAAENRAALIALAVFVTGRHPAALAPEARDWPRAPARRIILRNRHDLAQHFVVSAAIAAAAGEPLAHAIGLYKEIDDARRGSGFSFADLAADRAGTRFGHLAARSAGSARALQAQVMSLGNGDLLMPAIADLPEGIGEREFARRFGRRDTREYLDLVAEIDRRIAALPIFQAAGG